MYVDRERKWGREREIKSKRECQEGKGENREIKSRFKEKEVRIRDVMGVKYINVIRSICLEGMKEKKGENMYIEGRYV